MFAHFILKRDIFLLHYHKQSNVESTFSMIKRKFGDSVRNKTERDYPECDQTDDRD